MVDEGRVARLLRDIDRRVERLRSAAGRGDADRDELWLDGIKYLFVTAIEGCVDVAQHIVSAERLGAPDSNADAVRMLPAREVIEPGLAEEIARAVGFRNVLVHQYVAVDDEIVIDALDRLDRLAAFVSSVSEWLVEQ